MAGALGQLLKGHGSYVRTLVDSTKSCLYVYKNTYVYIYICIQNGAPWGLGLANSTFNHMWCLGKLNGYLTDMLLLLVFCWLSSHRKELTEVLMLT